MRLNSGAGWYAKRAGGVRYPCYLIIFVIRLVMG